MLLKPEAQRCDLIARIEIAGNQIQTALPSRHQGFVDLVRRLGYSWEAPAWTRRIAEQFHGSVADRAIELALTLLEHGFLVDVSDPGLVERIIAGEYTPECRRWIKAVVSGPHTGWVGLTWPYHDDLWRRAKRAISSTVYADGQVVAPPDAYRQIRDFAEEYQFRISEQAEMILRQAQTRFEEAVLIVPKRRRANTSHAPSTEIVPAGQIHPDLRDDDDSLDNDHATAATSDSSR